MTQGRMRMVLVAAVILAVLSSAGAVVVHRRQSADEKRQARALAALEAEARQAAAARRAAREVAEDEDSSDGGGLFDEFVSALGGGDATAAGTAVLLDRCTTAFATGVPPGSVSFLPNRKERGASVEEQLRTVAANVEELRGLAFRHVPDPVFVTADEMTRRVTAHVRESLSSEATAAEARALVALGALPPGTDLEALTLDSLGGAVAGYYEPATGELVVARKGTGSLNGTTRTVLAHELDHALTDQVIGLPDNDGQPPPGTEDAALARLALVEGDATLAMQLYSLAHVPLLEQFTGLTDQLASQEDLAVMPFHLQRNFTFPYLEGLSFACALYEAGGWTAVDHAYAALPTTSAQVLFPERYLAGEGAVDPRDPGSPGGTWKADPRRALGAAELQWLLEAPGGDVGEAVDHPAQRAAAWAGGEVQVWTDGVRTAAGVALVQHAGQTPLCATMTAWYSAAFPTGKPVGKEPGEALAVDGSRRDAVIRCAGTDVRIGIGPDLATARAIAQ